MKSALDKEKNRLDVERNTQQTATEHLVENTGNTAELALEKLQTMANEGIEQQVSAATGRAAGTKQETETMFKTIGKDAAEIVDDAKAEEQMAGIAAKSALKEDKAKATAELSRAVKQRDDEVGLRTGMKEINASIAGKVAAMLTEIGSTLNQSRSEVDSAASNQAVELLKDAIQAGEDVTTIGRVNKDAVTSAAVKEEKQLSERIRGLGTDMDFTLQGLNDSVIATQDAATKDKAMNDQLENEYLKRAKQDLDDLITD